MKSTSLGPLLKSFGLILISLIFSFNKSILIADELNKKKFAQEGIGGQLNLNYLKNIPRSEYILGPGDFLTLVIADDIPEFIIKTSIDGMGTIELPRLGRVFVQGLTKNELVDLLNESYEQYINFPDVAITIDNFRPMRIFIDGEVNSPGLYTIAGVKKVGVATKNEINSLTIDRQKSSTSFSEQNKIATDKFLSTNSLSESYLFPTVYDLIQVAGGVKNNADLSNIEIKRIDTISNGGGKVKTNINLLGSIKGNQNNQNIRIFDGDIIFVSESDISSMTQISDLIKSNLNPKFINIYLSGKAIQPGLKLVPNYSSASDLLEMFPQKTLKGSMFLYRSNIDGTTEKRRIKISKTNPKGSFNNPFLKDGDIVRVGNNKFSVAAEIISELTNPMTGIYSTYRVIKLFD